MDNKRVKSSPANLNDMATSPPREVDSPLANSDDMVTAPPHEVDSPTANSDDVAIAPPHEVASPPANSADMATAPPPKMVDHCQPQPQLQPHLYPPMAMQMPQMQIAPASAPAPALPPRPGSKVYYQTTSETADSLEMICIHCNARIHPREEHHPTEMTYAVSAMFCATLLLWPAVVVPFCCKWFYKTLLFCPKCHAWLGKL